MSEAGKFADNATADACNLRTGQQKNSFYAGKFAVDVGNVQFVFIVFYTSYASQYKVCFFFLGKVNCQSAVFFNTDSGFFLIKFFNGTYSFCCGNPRLLLCILHYSNHNMVKKEQPTLYNVSMAYGKWIERTREYCLFHAFAGFASSSCISSSVLSSSTIRLSMMKFWRSMVFFPM